MHKSPTVSAPSLLLASADHPADAVRVKTEGQKRCRPVDLVDREAKARERMLRNRAAAQVSRERKRRYLEELESDNLRLKLENASLASRLSSVESDNHGLTHKLEAVTLQLNAMQNQMSLLASLALYRNSAATQPLAQPSSPASIGTPVLCSDTGSDAESDRKADEAWSGDEKLAVDFGESAALTKLAPEIDSQLFASILVDSLGPSYPSGVPSLGMQESQGSTSTAALAPQAGRPRRQLQARQRKGIQAHGKKNQPTIRRSETLMPDIPMDGSFDVLSSLVDVQLFEQTVQSPDDDNTSRNSQAPADFDANVLLSNYGSLFDAQTPAAAAASSSAFPPIF